MANKYKLICRNCHNNFMASSPRTYYCDNCYEERICCNENCNNKISKPIMIADPKQYECLRCIRSKIANKTMKRRMKIMKENGTFEKFQKAGTKASAETWKNMSEEEIKERTSGQRNYLKNWWKNSSEEERNKRIKPMINGVIHRWNTISDKERNSHILKNKAPGLCSNKECKKFNKHRDQNARGIECGCSKKFFKKFNQSRSLFQFNDENGKRYYRGIEIIELIQKFNNNEIEIPYGFKKYKNRWLYGNRDILNDKVTELNSNNILQYIDGNLYYYDQLNKEYLEWEKFKDSFKLKDDSNLIFANYQFIKIPTFRSQKSDSWEGNKILFEQSLIDMDINWFVYIKFDENDKALVAGKTGSLNVNNSGTDLLFSTDIKHGFSRLYLHEQNLDWNKTYIAILSCSNEKEALKIEKEIQLKEKLLKS